MKKSGTFNKMLGWVELLSGVVLASPLDEILVTAGTSGGGIVLSPIQLPSTAVLGGIIFLDGLERLGIK